MPVYQLTKNHVSSRLEGESVILDHKAGKYFGLNETGTLVWEVLQKNPADFETLKNSIMEKFDVDDQTCENDLENLLSDLIDEKLVEKV
jgi:hypothetical protein